MFFKLSKWHCSVGSGLPQPPILLPIAPRALQHADLRRHRSASWQPVSTQACSPPFQAIKLGSKTRRCQSEFKSTNPCNRHGYLFSFFPTRRHVFLLNFFPPTPYHTTRHHERICFPHGRVSSITVPVSLFPHHSRVLSHLIVYHPSHHRSISLRRLRLRHRSNCVLYCKQLLQLDAS